MHHWDINTAGRLERVSVERVSAPVEQGCEVSLNCEQMEPPPEDQQSQQGVQRDPNAYRSMRDHIHPPRVSAPSCIIPPAEDVAVKIHTHTSGILRKFARLSKRVQPIWSC